MKIQPEKNTKLIEALNKLNPKYYPLIAFVLTAVVYAFALSITGVLGNGVFVLETGDMKAQHIPFIMQMGEVLRGKHSLWYSWNIGLGQSTIGSYAYYTFSPFNIFYWIFGNKGIHIASALVIILKAATSALTFQLFISEYLRHKYFETVLFSMMYALNGFVISYFHTIVFMDAVLIFPLIMLGMLRLIRENKKCLLIIAYLYVISVQLYMGYIACVSSFIVILVYYGYIRKYLDKTKKSQIVTGYVLSVLAAVGITAFIWLPAGLNILEFANSSTIYETRPACNIVMLLNNMFIGEYQSIDGFVPYYYCGILAVIAIPLFLLNKHIEKRKRIYYGISLGILCILMLVPQLNSAMHGFDEPNCLGFRYSFVLSFLMITILAKEFPFLINYRNHRIGFLLWFVSIYVFVFLINRFVFLNNIGKVYETLGEDFNSNKIWVLIINIVFIGLIYLVICCYRNKKYDLFTKRTLFGVLIVVECIVNIAIVQKRFDGRDTVIIDESYMKAQINTAEILKKNNIKDSKEYIRTIYQDSYITDVALENDLPSLAFFTSLFSDKLIDTLVSLGYEYKSNCVTGAGWTPVSATLLGIDYIIDGAKIVSDDTNAIVLLGENGNYYQKFIYNDRVLPIAFKANRDILSYTRVESVFDTHEKLYSAITGKKEKFYEPIEMLINSDDATISYQNEGVIIRNNNYPESDAVVKYRTSDAIYGDIYANLYNELPVYRDSIYKKGPILNPLYGKEIYNTYKPKVYPNQAFIIDKSEDGINGFDMVIPENMEYVRYNKGSFVEFDEEEFDRIFHELLSGGMDVKRFEDGYVEGVINFDEDCVLFTSIPYEKGWKAYVDGKKVKVEAIVDDTFCGLNIFKGKHDIILEYVPPGRTGGFVITVFTVFVILANMLIIKIRETKLQKA